MRYISLTSQQEQLLTQLYQTSTDHRERQRAHALLLSHRNYAIPDLADRFAVDRDTISHWMDRWQQGLPTDKTHPPTSQPLQDQPRSGRPPTLAPDQKKRGRVGKDGDLPHSASG